MASAAQTRRKQWPIPKIAPATRRAARRAGDDYGVTARPDWRERDWPAHLHQVEIAGRQVNYADLGTGSATPVVFVHGLGGQWQNWLENMPRFAEKRRVVALDLPGFGCSEMPTEEISIPGYARTVEALCERLELGPCVVVGNSMGGFVATELAIRFPERVEQLVLVSPAGITATQVRKRPIMTAVRVGMALTAATASQLDRMALRPGLRHLALAWVARHPSRLAPDLVYQGMMLGADKPGFFGALAANLDYDFRDRLGEVACPTLLVWGRQDMIIPVRDADEFERLIPNVEKVILEDTGHVGMIERPETFNGLLADFIAGRDAAADAA